MKAWHIQSDPMITRRKNTLKIQVAVNSCEHILNVWLRVEPDNEHQLVSMKKVVSWCSDDIYQVTVERVAHQEQTPYCFKIQTPEGITWLGAAGLSPFRPTLDCQFKELASEKPPQWVREQVFYQIFPERFANGDAALSPLDQEYQYFDWGKIIAKKWDDLPVASVGGIEFYGGDLVGIQQKLDYIQSLGVTALYLNPIFTSLSNHKYDTVDYFNVDPKFGGNDALVNLITEIKKRKMRLILDAVINHTSTEHPWFKKAQAGDLHYRKFYIFDAENHYWSWKGYETLPVLDYSQDEVIDTFYRGDNAVLKHWLRPPYQIDGWRMDVIHMLGEGTGAQNNLHHVQQMRQAIKDINPDAYFLGEHFSEATTWLQGDAEDASMNYFGFTIPVWGFIAGFDVDYHPINIDASVFSDWLSVGRSRIPYDIQLSQFNLLDSHDTKRFATLVKGSTADIKLAMALLFTYPGVPSLYYGDEIGLQGDMDPDCRRTMPWQCFAEHDLDILQYVKKLSNLRLKNAAITQGGYLDVYAENDVFAFARIYKKQIVFVVINRGAATTLPINAQLAGLSHVQWQADALDTNSHFNELNFTDGLVLKNKQASVFIGSFV